MVSDKESDGYAFADFFKNNSLWFIQVNTTPGVDLVRERFKCFEGSDFPNIFSDFCFV